MRSDSVGRPWSSSPQSVAAIGSTGTVGVASPPVIVTGLLSARLPATATRLRKCTRSPVWSALVISTKSIPFNVVEAMSLARRSGMSDHPHRQARGGLVVD